MNELSKERLYEILNSALDIMYSDAICSEHCMKGKELEFLCEELEITEDEYYVIRENSI